MTMPATAPHCSQRPVHLSHRSAAADGMEIHAPPNAFGFSRASAASVGLQAVVELSATRSLVLPTPEGILIILSRVQ